MPLDQAAAIRVVNEYLDQSGADAEGRPLRFKEAFEKIAPGVGVHELDAEMRVGARQPGGAAPARLPRGQTSWGASCGRSS
jgi:hypothetical protein